MDFTDLSDAAGGLLSDPNKAGLMGLAQGLLAASGPSRIPVSMGQAMGYGLQGMQQGRMGALQMQRAGIQNQLDAYNLQRQKIIMDLLQRQAGGQPPTSSAPVQSQPAIPPTQGGLLGSGTFGIPVGGQEASPPQANAPQANTPPTMMGNGPQVPNPASPSIFGQTPEQLYQQGMVYSLAGLPAGAEMMKIAVDHDPRLALQMPTDAVKNAWFGTGGDMGAARGLVLSKAQADGAKRLGNGTAIVGGQIVGIPGAAPAGYINNLDPRSGQWSVAPMGNGPQAVASSSAAASAGTGLGRLATTPQPTFNSATGQPGNALNPYGIQIPGVGPIGGVGAGGAPNAFVPSGPMQGSEKIANTNADNYVSTQQAIPRVLNSIEGDKNALDLVNNGTFVTGNGSDKKYDWAALAQTWGIPVAKGATADYQLAHKYLMNSLSQTANDMGMNGSDARFAAAAQGNPNIETQGPKALADSIRWVAGMKSGVPAYAQAQQQWMATHNNSPTSLSQFQQQWNRAYDPNVFVTRWLQQRYGDQAAQEWIADHKLDKNQLARSYTTIKALGAF